MKLPLTGGSYEGRSTNIAPEVCLNWFFEETVGGESLVSTPGATVFSSPAVGEVRGGIEYNGLAYFVVGNTLYEINSAGAATSRGTLTTSTGRVTMAHNGARAGGNQQIFIADGSPNGYVYDNTTSTLTANSKVDYIDEDGNTLSVDVSPETVVFVDGYFAFQVKNTDRFYITNLYDGATIDPSDWATAEGDPDKLVAIASDRRDLFLFGEKTLEVWYNSGDADNTFQRYQGGSTQTGCAAKYSVARFDNTLCWLTKTERGGLVVARMGEGYNPQIISTPEVNYRLSTYTTFSNAFAYTYQHEGHEFYAITFPSHGATEVYDASTQKWHQRGHTIGGVFPNRERYNCHVFAFGKHLFGDFANGNIYVLDTSVGTLDGTRIPRERVTGIFTEEEKRIRISALQLDMEEGGGDPNVATDTSMWLSYSKDGGHSYTDEVERSMGDAGEYARRVIWRRLGFARNWIFKFRTWSPNPMVLKGLYARLYGEK
jgi:hypothetical protein